LFEIPKTRHVWTSTGTQAQDNELEVRFQSPVEYARRQFQAQADDYPVLPAALVPEFQGEDHANHIRKMQSSFSWDWGPAFPTVGLWYWVILPGFYRFHWYFPGSSRSHPVLLGFI